MSSLARESTNLFAVFAQLNGTSSQREYACQAMTDTTALGWTRHLAEYLHTARITSG